MSTHIKTIQTLSENFTSELTHSYQGKTTSLPFITHTLSTSSIVKKNERFQVLVIGGSMYQKACITKKEDNFHLIDQEQGSQPPFKTDRDLYTFLEQHIDPAIEVLALNFAYPMTPIFRDGRLDGRLQNGTKENEFIGLAGNIVGESIENYFAQKHNRSLKVSAANDTICLLLSGLTQYTWDEIAAGIVGTGLNCAIFLDEKTCVNLESANFNKFPQTEAGKEIDAASAAPGKGLCEKYVSGAYLYKHFNILARERGMNILINSTQELDMLGQNSKTAEGKLAREVLKQSYSLTAAQIAGILQFCNRDLVFIMQGSLFWRGYQYKENVEKLVEKICPEYKATYVNIFHSDLYGAAKLVG